MVASSTRRPTAALPGGAIRPRRKASARAWALRLGSVVVLLVAWEFYGRSVNPLLLASPTSIMAALWELVRDGTLVHAFAESMQPFLVGLVLSVVAGVVIGVLLGRFAVVEESLLHLLNAFYTVPAVALVPVVILWFGLGFTAKVAIIVIIAIFPILFTTHDGIRAISQQHVDVARAYGASGWDTLRSVMIPAALPFIMSGFRQSAGRALIGLIVAELFTGLSGLGALIAKYTNSLQTDRVLAVVVVLGVIGSGLIAGGSWLERRVTPWKPSRRSW
ncbi:MAG: ABC transporter permease subunit [Streptosporangiales bacterium]|nr:ABC transporter permease subunit [Streptosporangiales bacterium]